MSLLRRGDDGLTDRQRRRMAARYARTLGATPDAATFARARARHLSTPRAGAVSLAASPTGTGLDAAGTVSPSAVPACLVCGGPSVPGDDVALCKTHGGLGPAWVDFDEAAWLAGREAS